MDFSSFNLSQKIMLPTGIVLMLVLLIAPWHSIDAGFASLNRTALQSPNSLWGLLAFLFTIALVAVGVMRAFGLGSLPEQVSGQSWERIMFLVSAVVLGFLLLKLVIETNLLGWGAWVSVLLAAGQAYGGFEGQKA
ncbi:MAG: hypothetical protein P8N02_08185, partial [Actinomycetota bacterium]|jgi:hypothetical protein|nr:hypothetical protein [Actinomycetota bacterium]